MNSVEIIKQLGINAKKAAAELANINNEQKNKALYNLKENLIKFSSEIIQSNNKDIENAHNMKLSSALIDRLALNEDRINGMVNCLDEIITLKDPTGIVLSEWDRPNGLHIQKVSVPFGVIGIIYESRPNVTVDASAIAIKAGNSVILRGGKDSFHSSQKLNEIINKMDDIILYNNDQSVIDKKELENIGLIFEDLHYIDYNQLKTQIKHRIIKNKINSIISKK